MSNRNSGKALVLGAGGFTGTSWEIGLIKGLSERGVDLSRASMLLGTSSGAVAAALLTRGDSLEDLLEEQLTVPQAPKRLAFGTSTMLRSAVAGLRGASESSKRTAIAAAGARARSESAEPAVEAAERRFSDDWPDRDLRITAMSASTGDLRIFTRADGVSLGRVVTASCALPFIFPPVEIQGELYVDGSVCSTTNADQATGVGRIVVLAPLPRSRGRGKSISAQLRSLSPAGQPLPAAAVAPDRRALRAIKERIFDPQRCPPAARAGYAQSAEMLRPVADTWRG